MDKFQNKYRIPSTRLQTWDYGNNGAYFITICTHNREHYFGEIEMTQFIASESGKLAEQFWLEIPNYFSFVELGNFVVMPNHIHGILIIDKNANGMDADGMDADGMDADGMDADGMDADANVETRLIASLPIPIPIPTTNEKSGGIAGDKNPMFQNNISRIVRWYKGRCSFEMHKTSADFAWQSRFHDHIIRNSGEFERIQNYIANNPMNWKEDKFNG